MRKDLPMRRTASEMIRSLEMRVARLEQGMGRKAGRMQTIADLSKEVTEELYDVHGMRVSPMDVRYALEEHFEEEGAIDGVSDISVEGSRKASVLVDCTVHYVEGFKKDFEILVVFKGRDVQIKNQ